MPTVAHGDLGAVQRAFEEYGRRDPLYAALARRGYAGNQWDPDAFFATGGAEIAEVMSYLEQRAIRPQRGRALDFGCAVGRLAQALGDYFERVDGVDIASAMIDHAREFNRHGERVSYHTNVATDLALFESGSFDLVYSNKVLQHIPPAAQLTYIREFVRVLRPGGVAVFQTRNGPVIRSGTVHSLLYRLNRIHFRRIQQRIRGRPAYEMHFVARELVESAVREAGGHIADIADLSRGRPNRSLRYCVTA